MDTVERVKIIKLVLMNKCLVLLSEVVNVLAKIYDKSLGEIRRCIYFAILSEKYEKQI